MSLLVEALLYRVILRLPSPYITLAGLACASSCIRDPSLPLRARMGSCLRNSHYSLNSLLLICLGAFHILPFL